MFPVHERRHGRVAREKTSSTLQAVRVELVPKGIGLPLEEIFKVWRSAVFPHGGWQTIKATHVSAEAYVWFRGQMKEKFEHDCKVDWSVANGTTRGEVSICDAFEPVSSVKRERHR